VDQTHPSPDRSGDGNGDAPPPSRKAGWPWIVAATVLILFVALVLVMILRPQPKVTTDDAYVTAHYASIAPRVSGQVMQVAVDDNQFVHRGDLLIALDPQDYQAALEQAEAEYQQDLAQVVVAQTQVQRQPAIIEQAQAQILSAKAALLSSHPNAVRYDRLASTGAGSQQQHQQTVSQEAQDEATLKQAQANYNAAVFQLKGLRADTASEAAKVNADLARVRAAKLNLSYTRIAAPIDGVIDRRSVQVGNYVTPGAAMLAVVPLDAIYIEANYRELALRHMRPGQRVHIHVDAYDIWLNGYVQSIPASSGAAFSPIPPNNATGNFTKIVQRLPVKIMVAPNQPEARLLRVGMSVETTVDTSLQDGVAGQVDPDVPVATP